ncbi:hypothetical protein P3W85_20085 [Cupriavidus basilensis]|uniref:Uncharacterized protein n=1 Tax=Cupriavidus basilensis TaxID=68895 RepID=A0ABT6AS80_9BURK|nr:hypothetical protein [Cupriavidus basilensis]MDF3835243.1 hypothetical protein [Cupriavidus basilensis]
MDIKVEGIDIGKNTLDLNDFPDRASRQFTNVEPGIATLLAYMAGHNAQGQIDRQRRLPCHGNTPLRTACRR